MVKPIKDGLKVSAKLTKPFPTMRSVRPRSAKLKGPSTRNSDDNNQSCHDHDPTLWIHWQIFTPSVRATNQNKGNRSATIVQSQARVRKFTSYVGRMLVLQLLQSSEYDPSRRPNQHHLCSYQYFGLCILAKRRLNELQVTVHIWLACC